MISTEAGLAICQWMALAMAFACLWAVVVLGKALADDLWDEWRRRLEKRRNAEAHASATKEPIA